MSALNFSSTSGGAPRLTVRVTDTLLVNLGTRSYPIHFGENLVGRIRTEVERLHAEGRRVAVVTDANVALAQANAGREMFGEAPLLAMQPGETAKSLGGLGRVLDFLADQRLDRHGVIFAMGGGVMGDLGGFAAATWLRGVDYYQVPTTLLAMVDSSVGGKTGINLAAGKNLVGAFHQPRGVFISTGLLGTLPVREFAAGTAEVIKCALLGDPALLASLEVNPLTVATAGLGPIIRRCCALKARIVEADERETAPSGGRALLNLGHTFGHAIETIAGYGEYLHGEAVAIGLCAAARLSRDLGLVGPAEVGRVERLVAAHRLPTSLRSGLPLTALQRAMAQDKKARAGGLRFVVLSALGDAAVQSGIPDTLVETAWREVGAV